MGLPQHWLQDDVVAGMERLADDRPRPRRARSRSTPTSTTPQSVTPAGGRGDPGDARRRRPRRAQPGRAHARRQRRPRTQLLDLCFALLDGAGIMPYYFYMCDMIPFTRALAGLGRARRSSCSTAIMGYLPGFATPRIVCDVPFVGKRWVHQLEEYDRERGISYWTKNYRTVDRGRRPRRADPDATSTTTRSTRCPRPARSGGASTGRRSTTTPPPRRPPPRARRLLTSCSTRSAGRRHPYGRRRG